MNQTMQWTSAAAFTALMSVMSCSAAIAAEDSGQKDQKAQIEQTYKSARAQCDQRGSTEKDVCLAEAKGKRDKQMARADAESNPGPHADENRRLADANADYDVARARCGAKAGNDKEVCLKDAKAQWTQARADAQANKKTADAREDAAEQRCDSLSGDAKSRCEAKAKHEPAPSSGMSGSTSR